MSSTTTSGSKRDLFFLFLALVSFVADVYTLAHFVLSENILDFWTFRWIISIIFVALLAVGGFLFLVLAGSDDVAEKVLIVFGILYMLFSIAVYLFWGYQQALGGLSFLDYFGFLVLFTIVCSVGLFGIGYGNTNNLRLPSYGYATANLLFIFLLINKYVLEGSSFIFWQFVGEVLILVIGAFLFIGLYTESTESG